MDRDPCVYILASRRNGTIYTGVTSNLFQRLWQHRNGITKGFVSRYAVWRLLWFEMHGDMDSAITREKRIKEWQRTWKVRLIERENPEWRDLAIGFGFEPVGGEQELRHPGEGRDP
jgi:putative endonuclease